MLEHTGWERLGKGGTITHLSEGVVHAGAGFPVLLGHPLLPVLLHPRSVSKLKKLTGLTVMNETLVCQEDFRVAVPLWKMLPSQQLLNKSLGRVEHCESLLNSMTEDEGSQSFAGHGC